MGTAATGSRRVLLLQWLVGAILLLAGMALAAWTERGMARYHAALAVHGTPSEVPRTGEIPAGEGMVRVSGTPASSVVADPQFGLSVATPVLWREVEMFQWREVAVGGAVHYELDWVDHPVDAARFRHPAGHANPGMFPIQSARLEAGEVSVNGQRLDGALVRALPGRAPVTPDLRSLPANLAASFSLHDGALVTSSRPGQPRLGDLRVRWEQVPLQPVTLLARARQGRLLAAAGTPAAIEDDVQVGQRSLAELLPDLPAAPVLPWLRRLAALLLAVAGVGCLLWPRRRDGLLALGIGLGLIGMLGMVSWLGAGLAGVIGWLALGLLGFASAAWQLRIG